LPSIATPALGPLLGVSGAASAWQDPYDTPLARAERRAHDIAEHLVGALNGGLLRAAVAPGIAVDWLLRKGMPYELMVSVDPRQPTTVAIVNRLRDRATVHARRPASKQNITASLLARRSLQGLHAVLRGVAQFNDVTCAFSSTECPVAHGDTLLVTLHVLGLAQLNDDALRNYSENADRPIGRQTAGAYVKDLTQICYTARQVMRGREIHPTEIVNGGGAPDAQIPVLVRAAALAAAWGFVRLCGPRRYRVPGGHIAQQELLTRLCCALPHEFRLIAAADDDLRC
jgi:hypothetical protein